MIDQLDELFFDAIKEHRGDYFVEYRPPRVGASYAVITLVFLKPTALDAVAAAMEAELRIWLSRYAVPIMVTAFDEADNLVPLTQIKPDKYLVGWRTPESDKIAVSWKLDDLDAFLKLNPLRVRLQDIYVDVPFRTKAQVKATADKQLLAWKRYVCLQRIWFFFWGGVLPVTTATVDHFAPDWLSKVIYAYSFWNAYLAWRRIYGRKPPSKSETAESEKRRRMEHYYYHCERNSVGFLRLKAENFERDARARTREESARIADGAALDQKGASIVEKQDIDMPARPAHDD